MTGSLPERLVRKNPHHLNTGLANVSAQGSANGLKIHKRPSFSDVVAIHPINITVFWILKQSLYEITISELGVMNTIVDLKVKISNELNELNYSTDQQVIYEGEIEEGEIDKAFSADVEDSWKLKKVEDRKKLVNYDTLYLVLDLVPKKVFSSMSFRVDAAPDVLTLPSWSGKTISTLNDTLLPDIMSNDEIKDLIIYGHPTNYKITNYDELFNTGYLSDTEIKTRYNVLNKIYTRYQRWTDSVYDVDTRTDILTGKEQVTRDAYIDYFVYEMLIRNGIFNENHWESGKSKTVWEDTERIKSAHFHKQFYTYKNALQKFVFYHPDDNLWNNTWPSLKHNLLNPLSPLPSIKPQHHNSGALPLPPPTGKPVGGRRNRNLIQQVLSLNNLKHNKAIY